MIGLETGSKSGNQFVNDASCALRPSVADPAVAMLSTRERHRQFDKLIARVPARSVQLMFRRATHQQRLNERGLTREQMRKSAQGRFRVSLG